MRLELARVKFKTELFLCLATPGNESLVVKGAFWLPLKIFLEEAVDNISKDKTHYFKLFIKKILSFYFIDINSKYQNYYNIFHIFPMIMISILSFPGLFLFYEKSKFEKKLIYLYFFINLLLFSVFFILPRYKITILPIQIIFASYFIAYVFKRLHKTN